MLLQNPGAHLKHVVTTTYSPALQVVADDWAVSARSTMTIQDRMGGLCARVGLELLFTRERGQSFT